VARYEPHRCNLGPGAGTHPQGDGHITVCAYTMEHAYQKALELFLEERKGK